MNRTGGDYVTSTPTHPRSVAGGRLRIDRRARPSPGVKPIKSVDELAQPDLWESDEEYEAFLADLYASRRTGFA